MMSTSVLRIDSMQQADESSHKNQLEEMTKVIASRRHFFYLIALRQLRNAADAEDAIQDAFLSAYKHVNPFKGRAQMPTWLSAIVKNAARMQLRRVSGELNT